MISTESPKFYGTIISILLLYRYKVNFKPRESVNIVFDIPGTLIGGYSRFCNNRDFIRNKGINKYNK